MRGETVPVFFTAPRDYYGDKGKIILFGRPSVDALPKIGHFTSCKHGKNVLVKRRGS